MGFHFLITTSRAFPFKFFRDKIPISPLFEEWFTVINFVLQLVGSSALAYKIIFHIERGINHENNIELFILTTPFTIMQSRLLFLPSPYRKSLGHPFYIKYLTLQMLPGTMIVFARDSYWMWGPGGLANIYARIFIEFAPMVPFFMVVWPKLFGGSYREAGKKFAPLPVREKDQDTAIMIKCTTTNIIRHKSISDHTTITPRLSA
ncbi:hypothetical protein TWF718_006551 [Orbilia javanica]|uniref:Uncharacterized protein n=1 Tax=Orbilia javanica TaxID=47235 RepID=A0AAN8RMZ5_9PEZI